MVVENLKKDKKNCRMILRFQVSKTESNFGEEKRLYWEMTIEIAKKAR